MNRINRSNAFAFIFAAVWLLPLLYPIGEARSQQLRELDIQQNDPPPLPLVLTEYPDQAYLIFESSIQNLSFASNWKIFENRSNPENGRYVLVVDTVRQALRISAPGSFQTKELNIPSLSPRQAIYYTVEPANQRQFEQILDLYSNANYSQAIEQLNSFLLFENVEDLQREHAMYLMAMSLHNLDRINEGQQTLRELLNRNPEYVPFTNGAPTSIIEFTRGYQDSLWAVPPNAPENLDVRFAGDRIALSWTPNTENDLDGYHIYRGNSPVRMRRVATMGRESRSYSDEDFVVYETYFYYITAFDSYITPKESLPSDLQEIEIRPPLSSRMKVELAQESAISNLELQSIQDSVLTISYNLNGEYRQTYDIMLYVSNRATGEYNIIPNALSGDFGGNVQDGNFKNITWNVREDFPRGLPDREYRLRVDALPQPFADQVRVIVEQDSLIRARTPEARNDSLVVINYALTGPPKKSYAVDLTVSDNRGQTYSLVSESFTGDWGAKQKPGANKSIEWNVFEFFPDGLATPINIRISATEETSSRRKHTWKYIAGGSVVLGIAAFLIDTSPPPPPPAGQDPVASGPIGRPE